MRIENRLAVLLQFDHFCGMQESINSLVEAVPLWNTRLKSALAAYESFKPAGEGA